MLFTFTFVKIYYMIVMTLTYGQLKSQFYTMVIILIIFFGFLCLMIATRIKMIILLYQTNKGLGRTITNTLQIFPDSVIVHSNVETAKIVFCNNTA